jgi:formylglycine-generating enzyme required for sulfatase activity
MGDRHGDRDEKPVHQVHLDAFYLDLHPVTQAQYLCFVSQTGHGQQEWEPVLAADDHPVVMVSWEDAVAYCHWAKKRLPSEAEWEKAARGPDGRTYPWGSSFEPGRANVVGRGYAGTAPAGNFPSGASPYGLLDMAGNVWEWAADFYAADYYAWSPTHNPTGPDKGSHRVVRGGCWICHPRYLRCAKRERQPSTCRSRFIGFRGVQ